MLIKLPIGSLKGEVKKRHLSRGQMFFCLPACAVEHDCSRVPFRELGTLRTVMQLFWFSLQEVFIASSRQSPSVLRPTSRTVVRFAKMKITSRNVFFLTLIAVTAL